MEARASPSTYPSHPLGPAESSHQPDHLTLHHSSLQVILVDFLLYFVSYHPDRAFPAEQVQIWGIQATSASQGAFPIWSVSVNPPSPPAYRRL